MAKEIIKANGIRKSFFIGQPNELEALHGIDLTVCEGEIVALIGESGSGKSTLMNIIGALDRATSGDYFLDGIDITKADDRELSAIRNKKIGFVFQTFNLISWQSAVKNVALPMMYGGVARKERTERALELLSSVGMEDRAYHKSNELSGGQKQRVCIARAIANNPSIILADEPTGALDSANSRMVMDIFHDLHKKQGKTIILITHNSALAEECDRVISLKDGIIISDRRGKMLC